MHGILKRLKESGLFSNIDVLKLIDEESVKFLKVKADVYDGSILYITEIYTENYQKYSYHWQKPNGDLIMRWDNRPHWRHLKTFPHHKHVGTEVLPSHRISHEEVLTEMKDKLNK
ncbi:MAG: hypothetical protein GY950_22595 [bacterium]|nr:hypothetical protein [bacterium]